MKVSKLSDHAAWQCCYLICGSYIGSGAYRKVYRNRIDAKSVIKIEEDSAQFSNIKEWEMWNQCMYGPLKKWFAPCLSISPSGQVLIQAKTTPCSPRDLPKKVPAFFTDLKCENWGWYKGNVVCHDYGNLLLTSGSKLKKAQWGARGYV